MKTSKGKADSSDPEVLAKYIDEIQLLLDEGQNQAFIIHHLVSERNLDQEMASLLYTQATFGSMDAPEQMSEQASQQKQLQSKALDKIDVEIRDKIIFWRNNAFSNVEIVQKLIDKYDVSESEAKQMVQTVHLKESSEEKAKEKEKEFANATSGQIALGFVLILIGVVGTVASEGTMFFYGAIGSGVVMIFAGFFRKKS